MDSNIIDKKFISFKEEAVMTLNWKPILDKLPEPFYTVAYFILKIDLIAVTLILYTVTSKVFGVSFKETDMALALVFGYLLFLDYIPYQFFKRKKHFISHYLWYKPIVFLPIGSISVFSLAGNAGADAYYLTVLFLTTAIGHFVLSAAGAPHGISFYPFKKYLALRKAKLNGISVLKPMILSKEEHDSIIIQAAENIRRTYGIKEPWDRTWHQELDSRKSNTDIWSILLLIVAVYLLLVF